MPFSKFWVVLMGFFQCSSVSFTGKTAILGADVQKNNNNKKKLCKYRYWEAALRVFMWRSWDHSWNRSLYYYVHVCEKRANGWSMIDHGDTDSPETLPMMFLRKSFTNIGGFFLAFSLAKIIELVFLHTSGSAWKLPAIKQKKNKVYFCVMKKILLFVAFKTMQQNSLENKCRV